MLNTIDATKPTCLCGLDQETLFLTDPLYIYIEIGIDMFHAFMTEGVLEQLFSSFNAALDGICS